MSAHPLFLLHERLIEWYDHYGRDLPMRSPSVSAWGTLVFEVMSQQTPIPRVQPIWLRWMEQWPTPTDLANAQAADVLIAWDRLGYPSRALRLRECAQKIVNDWDGKIPTTYDALTSLPGIGPYTASAVLAFHYRQRIPVLDTNIRRVYARLFDGLEQQASGAPNKTELAQAHTYLPNDAEESAVWNVAVMELGALICTARTPHCHECPIMQECHWRERGYPPLPQKKKTQTWEGTDRQARGKVMALLRAHHEEGHAQAPHEAVLAAATLPGAENDQAPRVLTTLLRDGLMVRNENGTYSLP